jgi:hypothetical protein
LVGGSVIIGGGSSLVCCGADGAVVAAVVVVDVASDSCSILAISSFSSPSVRLPRLSCNSPHNVYAEKTQNHIRDASAHTSESKERKRRQ